MTKTETPVRSDVELNRRGHFDASNLRAILYKLIMAHKRAFYRLRSPKGELNYLVDAGFLARLVPWLVNYPRLICELEFVGRKKPVRYGEAGRSVAFLSDADILSVSRMSIESARVTLWFYDKTAVAGTYVARAKGAPMKNLALDTLKSPYLGHHVGTPVIAISKSRFNIPAQPALEPDEGPIDAVYTWVDSEDPAWKSSFLEHTGGHTKTTHASNLRYLSRDELKFSLRSIRKNAPWIRNIYIVTDDQVPEWLLPSDRVTIIRHAQIFPDPSVLPVFNSHAIESCLHRIPGLSERYIYFNDDVFLGRPVKPTDFFTSNGKVKLFFSAHLSFNSQFVARGTLPTDQAFCNTIRLIEGRFGFTPVAKVLHTPHPMRRSVLEMIEQEHPEEMARTRAARIRSGSDLNVTGNLAYYYCLGLGMGITQPQLPGLYRYIDTGRRESMSRLFTLRTSPVKFFCLNLTEHREVPLKRQQQLLWWLLHLMFPFRLRHERSSLGLFIRRLFGKRGTTRVS